MSIEVGKWSIEDAGFNTIEIFNRDQEQGLVSQLTRLLGSPPQAPPRKQGVMSVGKPTTTISLSTWTLESVKIGEVFQEDAKRFQVGLQPLLPLYRTANVILIDNPTVPFLMLIMRVELNVEKIDSAKIRDQLRQLSLPFRLFVEKLRGLSTQLAPSWSPHVPNVTWLGVKVEESSLANLSKSVSRLYESWKSSVSLPQEREDIEREIRRNAPFDLADPAFNLSSYVIAFQNVHVIIGQSDQPGIGAFRTPSITYLTPESSLFKMPEGMRTGYLATFPSRVDWSPLSGESLLTWLVSFNLWANSRLMIASNLDQRAIALRKPPSIRSTTEEIAGVLSDASLLGTDAAVATGEVNIVRRRASSLLEELVTQHPLGVEIPLQVRYPFLLSELTKQGANVGVASALASMTKDSLDLANQQLKEIEREVAVFQRHISDIASLQAREASSKLNKRIATLTIILIVLTAALVAATIVIALKK